jgi:hypothetical protein
MNHPEMTQALRDIHEHVAKPTGSRIDFHPENVMFRREEGKWDQMVFTDPAAFGHVAPRWKTIPPSASHSGSEE